ncbi:Alpha-glucosidase [Apiospora arundinis]
MLCGKLRVILMSAFVFNIFQTMTGWGAQASNIQDGGDINHNDGVVCMYPVPGSEYKQKLPGTPSARPRTRFGVSGCATWAYPSVGGVVYGFFTAVQLKQLGLSNMEEANRSDNDDEEDRLSVAILQQGAHWWPSWGLYLRHSERMRMTPYDFHFPPNIYVAYPSSGKGVWVLKCSPDWRQEHDDDITKPSLPNVPEGLEGRRSLALTADEGCEALKHFGATFYESPGGCGDIPKTLDEGVQRGKRYEALLKRMEDMHYEDAWLEHGHTEWPIKKA